MAATGQRDELSYEMLEGAWAYQPTRVMDYPGETRVRVRVENLLSSALRALGLVRHQ